MIEGILILVCVAAIIWMLVRMNTVKLQKKEPETAPVGVVLPERKPEASSAFARPYGNQAPYDQGYLARPTARELDQDRFITSETWRDRARREGARKAQASSGGSSYTHRADRDDDLITTAVVINTIVSEPEPSRSSCSSSSSYSSSSSSSSRDYSDYSCSSRSSSYDYDSSSSSSSSSSWD